MQVIVAEKPSVARDIARILGLKRKSPGCIVGDGCTVTWALGHLVQFAEPDEYEGPWKGRWSFEQLPMVPTAWKLRTHKRTRDQFNHIKRLINDAKTSEVVCATDAGREGEHIFRLIYQHARCKKPVRRLWISSLTDAAIRRGFETLKPAEHFDDLAQAAMKRAQADWLVGLNLTRAYTVHNRLLTTIGRVQTPTLAMLVKREAEIENFKKAYFYELIARLKEGFEAKYSEDGQTRIETKARAEELHKKLVPHKVGTVTDIQKKIRRQKAPPLYDLTTLQRDANRRFGFTAAKVLEYAQALYETHKLITYPRTESRHISEDMVPQLPKVLAKLDHPQAGEALQRLEGGLKLGKTYVDKTKLTDHHAILPTGAAVPPALPPPLKKVYDLVVARFVAIFLPEHVVEETTVVLDIGGATFVAKGGVVLEVGWKVVEPKRERPKPDAKGAKGAEEDAQQEFLRQKIPPLEKGQQVHIEALDVVERETNPPKRYTDATLLSAMKNAGRQIDDDDLAAAMKESGLGTPATRAETIEKLIRIEVVERQKKSLAPTSKGKALIGVVAPPLKSPELTGQWEQRLKEIEEGKYGADAFYQSIVNFVGEVLVQVRQGPALSPADFPKQKNGATQQGPPLGSCPLCKEGQIRENAKAFGCSRYRQGCKFVIWKTVAAKKISAKQATQLLKQGKTDTLKGFTSKAGKKFSARLKLSPEFKVEFDFEDMPRPQANAAGPVSGQDAAPVEPSSPVDNGLACPRCGQGRIIEGKRGFGCNRFRDGCNFVVWKEVAGKKLTEKQIERLVGKGKTLLIKGFKSKEGRPFEAYLKLDPNFKTTFEFPARTRAKSSTQRPNR